MICPIHNSLISCIKIGDRCKYSRTARPYLYNPKCTDMQNETLIEVKCECKIPFHAELVGHLTKLVRNANKKESSEPQPQHSDAIRQAINSKILFIKMMYPAKRGRSQLLKNVEKLFMKNLVGTIKVGKDEITFILL